MIQAISAIVYTLKGANLKSPYDPIVLSLLSNDEIISPPFRRDYFSLSFFFENPIYVDIMRVFKEENKAKRIRPNDGVIILSLLTVSLLK